MDIKNLTWGCQDGWMYKLKYKNDNKQRYIKFEDVIELLKYSNNKQNTCEHIGNFMPISNFAKCEKCRLVMFVK